MLPRSLPALKRKKEQIEQEGYLLNCWIGTYRPGGTAKGKNSYCQLRSKEPLEHGKRTRHLKPEEIPQYRRLIENGRLLKKIERQMAYLERKKPSSRAVLTSSASDEWYTPPTYVELARQVMGGIDLDPASSDVAQAWIRAEVCYTKRQNGLRRDWRGRMWLNPPYGSQMSLWMEKAVLAHESGAVAQAVLLVRPAPGSAWYQMLSARFPSCITHRRIRFIDKDGQEQASPVHGNVFFYLGERVEQFREVFREIGVVARPF